MLRQILPKVNKPGRYIGGEIHAVKKDPASVDLRVALAFPDVYEVAFSHLGLKILYHLLNRRDDVWAERVYAPWPDMEEQMRAHNVPLYALESKDPIGAFDLIGFTLQQELCATNILQMLDLAGIALRAADRKDGDPIVIAGGPCTANPEALAAFFDAFVLGDGETVLGQIADVLIESKKTGRTRHETLKRLATLTGVYVPAFYRVTMDGDRVTDIRAEHGAPERVERAVVPDLNAVPYIETPLLPLVEPVHDRFAVEIQRGCSRGCRFCQAGVLYRPTRQRDPQKVLELARKGLKESGQETLGLLSLSASDYDHLAPLATAIFNEHANRHISVQLPSLRVEGLTEDLVNILNQERKTGFTLAPEAATERLRRVINKGNTEDDLINALETVFQNGWFHVKLYFMLGLPTETDEDIEAIVELARKSRLLGRRYDKRTNFNVSVSTFVPKAQTPFQWATMSDGETVDRKLNFLRQQLRRVKVNFKWHHRDISLLESAFARGDRRLADVIEDAYRDGARFDAWTDHLDMVRWRKAFADHGIDFDAYITREFTPGMLLPWSHLSGGVSEAFLQSEWDAAHAEALRPDCAYDRCFNCGVCDHKRIARRVVARPDSQNAEAKHVKVLPPVQASAPSTPAGDALQIVRFKFEKSGYAVFLGHLDVMAHVARAFKRAGFAVKHSEGFNPKPKIGFSPALPLGVHSAVEFFDAVIKDGAPTEVLLGRLNRSLPDGLRLLDARVIGSQTPSLGDSIVGFDYCFDFGDLKTRDELSADIAAYHAADSVQIERVKKDKTRQIELKDFVPSLELGEAATVSAELAIVQGRSVKPTEILTAVFGLTPDRHHAVIIEKSGVHFVPPRKISPTNYSDSQDSDKRRFTRIRSKESLNESEAHRQCHGARDPGGIGRKRYNGGVVHRKET